MYLEIGNHATKHIYDKKKYQKDMVNMKYNVYLKETKIEKET
jgi:hypothetical protein